MTFNKVWDETAPSDNQDASQGALDFRNLETAIRERLAVDHRALANEGSDPHIGAHDQVSLIDQVADLAGADGKTRLYAKKVGSVIEVFLVLSDNTVVQLTSNGKLNGGAFDALGNVTAGAGVIPIANLPAYPVVVGIAGDAKNLKAATASTTTARITADQIILQDAFDVLFPYKNLNVTVSLSLTGEGGIDNGVLVPSQWYNVWVIAKLDGTLSGLLSTSATNPVMPDEYHHKALISAVRINGSGEFVGYIQEGKEYWYNTWPMIASGSGALWTAINMLPYVPAISTSCFGSFTGWTAGFYMTNDSAVEGTLYGGNQYGSDGNSVLQEYWAFNLKTANTLYYGGGGNTKIYISGFRINKL